MKYQLKRERLGVFSGGINFDAQDFAQTSGNPIKDADKRDLFAATNVVIGKDGRLRTRSGFSHVCDFPAGLRQYFARQLRSSYQYAVVATTDDATPTPSLKVYMLDVLASAGSEWTEIAGLAGKTITDAIEVSSTEFYLATSTGIYSYVPLTSTLTLVDASYTHGKLAIHKSRLWHCGLSISASAPGDFTNFADGFSFEIDTIYYPYGALVMADSLFLFCYDKTFVVSGYSEDTYRPDVLDETYPIRFGESLALVELSGVGEAAMFVSKDGRIVAATRGGVVQVAKPLPGPTLRTINLDTHAAYCPDSGLYLATATSDNALTSNTIYVVHCSLPRTDHGWPVTTFELGGYGTSPAYAHSFLGLFPADFRVAASPLLTTKQGAMAVVRRTGGTTVSQIYFYFETDSQDSYKAKDDRFECSSKFAAWGAYQQVAASFRPVCTNLGSTSRKQWRRAVLRTTTPSASVTSLGLTHYRGRDATATSASTTATASTEMAHDLDGASEYSCFLVNLYQTADTSATAYGHSVEVHDLTIEAFEVSE